MTNIPSLFAVPAILDKCS
uniref:AMT9 n=1 Tax=Arundo donax TaxID=35708 RepID=A0A0A8XZH8_ARUDO